MLHPAKVATPLAGVTELAVHVTAAPLAVALEMAMVTWLLSPVATLPPASYMVTCGWVAKGMPPVEPVGLGCTAKLRLAPGPGDTVIGLLVADESEPSVAGSV